MGFSAIELEDRFSVIRTSESNLCNFFSDYSSIILDADCGIIISGTLRYNNVIPPGPLTLKTIRKIFAFPESLVLIEVSG